MPNRFSLTRSGYDAGWSARRRILIVALVITALLSIAGIAAWFTGHGRQHQGSTTPSTVDTASPSADPTPTPASAGTGSVPEPPQTRNPLAYAKAAAVMLWSYDTRDTSRDQQLAGMHAWMTTESKYADWSSVSGQVPDPVLWSRMGDNAQYATAKVTDAHYPSAFQQALADDPSAITQAYIYYVTVTGTQQIAWKNGGQGAEDQAVTLAVQCRASHDCSLVAIAPSVAP